MGLVKKDIPVSTLSESKEVNTVFHPVNKGRDFEKEARGKTRCSVWNAVAPAVINAGWSLVDWNKPEEMKDRLNQMLKLIDEVADHGVKYTFDER